jgi:hypothetical protein
MNTRRGFLQTGAAALLSWPAGARLCAQSGDEKKSRIPDGTAAKDMITPAAQLAIDQGLGYLLRHQHADGSFGSAQLAGNVAITSLAGLAMMASGSQPGRGPYSEAVTKALRYVVDQADGKGFLKCRNSNSNSPMYEHGFGTLFLSEAHGMTQERELRERLRETIKRALKLIVDSQNPEGGWRYQPDGKDADVSVTICQIMGLRAARNAGFFVPKSTVDRCIKYVKNCQDRDGGFHYQQQGGTSAFARSAAGLVALYSAGVYQGPEVESAMQYLMQFKPNGGSLPPEVRQHYYYGHYYAVQAMWTAGDPYWKEWFPAIRDELINSPDLDRQRFGCWTDHRFSNDYATAMACIILQIPNNYLPIFQK